MDLKLSYNWINEYLKSKKSVADFARELSLKCQSVERIHEVKPTFSGVITARIIDIVKHPNADKLRLPTVDTGREKLQIVCGAPNIEVGQIVPLALADAVLGLGTENFKIKKTNIRGIDSNGMLCSQKELGLGEDHTGIMILPPDTPIGKKLEEVMPINDYVLDIEVTSNRPDAMSVVGLAREGAAALGLKFDFKLPRPDLKIKASLPLTVKLAEPKMCPRYQAVIISGVKVGPSPLWLQLRLIQAGMRPINNLVDITNYILLEYGRPMHVFDYDKLSGQKIIIRQAKAGEKILALDGKVYELKPEMLVIADGKVPVAVGGIMGGEESAATAETKTIVFECAAFDPVLIRKTARALNLHSDSSSLFEKNLHPQSTYPAILRAIELTQQLAGGAVASKIMDAGVKSYKPVKIKFDPAKIKDHLGVDVPLAKVKAILQSLGFGISGTKILSVTVPWWRAYDVEYDYDLLEEVARIYGYHNLPLTLPQGEIPLSPKEPILVWEAKIKNILAAAGFTESLNYSMVSQKSIKSIGGDIAKAVKIFNPLNEELEYMRLCLVPGLLQNAADNTKNFSEIKIFELSHVYPPRAANDLPDEYARLTGVLTAGRENPYLAVKGAVEFLLNHAGMTDYQLAPATGSIWTAGQAFSVNYQGSNLGEFGLVAKNITEKFGLDNLVGLFDFDFRALATLAKSGKVYQPIPAFPESSRDLAVIFEQKTNWQEIAARVGKVSPLLAQIEYLSTFTDKTLGEGKKSLAFRLVFRSPERTLKSEEVDEVMKEILAILEKQFNAKLR